MESASRRHDRRSSTSDERRCSHGSRRENLALRPAIAAREDRRLPGTRHDPCDHRATRSTVPAGAINFLRTLGTWSVLIAPVLGLMWAGPPAAAPAPGGPPGSGIIVKSEVTAIWMPRALHDRARGRAGRPADRSPEELQACLERNGWRVAWYALTYRCHQIDGESTEITQVRRLSEAAGHLDELEAVMAAAAGRPPRSEAFALARVEIIPDTLLAVDPREAIARLMAGPVVEDACLRTPRSRKVE